MGSSPPSPHERAAALLRRQQSTTARLRAGLPDLLHQLDRLEEPGLADVEGFMAPDPDGSGTEGADPDGSDPAVDPGDGRSGEPGEPPER